jgi:hypothetical protein
LYSAAHMKRLEREMWRADIDVIDVWRSDLKSHTTLSKGRLFGIFHLNRYHVMALCALVAAILMREIYNVTQYKDPNG